MRRPANNLPFILKDALHFNMQSGYYEVQYNDVVFQLTMAQMFALKKYLQEKAGKNYNPEDWYKSLGRDDRARVLRSDKDHNTEFYDGGIV